MTKNLSAIKTQLQKIAQDIDNPIEQAAPAEGSPEQVMELIDDAIKVLEVAEETVPAEKPEEEETPKASPPIGAKTRKAQEEEDEEEEETKKEARLRKAQEDEEEEEDEEKKEMIAKIAKLEADLQARQKQAIAEEFVEVYPEEIREAKYDEIVNSKESVSSLQAKLKVAKEVYESNKNVTAYKPAKNESGYLFKKARMEQNTVAPWKV